MEEEVFQLRACHVSIVLCLFQAENFLACVALMLFELAQSLLIQKTSYINQKILRKVCRS